MKIILNTLLFSFVITTSSCKNINDLKSLKSTREVKIEEIEEKQNDEQVIDTLLLKSAKFNDHSLFLDYSNIIKTKDSIVKTIWECGNPFKWDGEEFEDIYCKGAVYVTNKKEAVLHKAFFIHSNELSFYRNNQKLVFNKFTTLDHFKKVFPTIETGKLKNGFFIGVISFDVNVNENSWYFTFDKNKKLIKFELYWWLC